VGRVAGTLAGPLARVVAAAGRREPRRRARVPSARHDENSAALEIRPILGRRFGRIELWFNPVVERGLRGRDTNAAAGWEFEPGARIAASVSERVTVGIEYYGKTGLFGSHLPANEHVHQFYPGVDWKLGDDLVFNAGVGFGTTSAGNRLVFKSRLEVPLGR
jgi:hypothetical protein